MIGHKLSACPCRQVKQYANFNCEENNDESCETTDSETLYDIEPMANAVEVASIESIQKCCKC